MNQRDVYEVYFAFPKDQSDPYAKQQFTPHPVIVLSTPSVYNCESTFVGVPISHSAEWNDDEFSFPIYDTDFDNKLRYQDSFVRLHLITNIGKDQLVKPIKKVMTMNKEAFDAMFDEILVRVFGYE